MVDRQLHTQQCLEFIAFLLDPKVSLSKRGPTQEPSSALSLVIANNALHIDLMASATAKWKLRRKRETKISENFLVDLKSLSCEVRGSARE